MLPRYLYKFTSVKPNLVEILKNAEIRFSSPLSFNDPFDCQIEDQTDWTPIKLLNELTRLENQYKIPIDYDLLTQKIMESDNYIGDLYSSSIKRSFSKIGVSCFTTKLNNHLMWSHYSRGHQGVCIKFDRTKDTQLFKETHKVIYSNVYPILKIHDNFKSDFYRAILTKSKLWGYEKEVRVIKPKNGIYKFNKTCISEIIFGCKVPQIEIDQIKEIIETAAWDKIKIRYATLSKKKFELEYK